MQNDLISIIVPVFNAEKTIDRCLRSIVDQTYPYLEIILVDDGSTDSSSILCDHWADKDARIFTYHKENGGVSSARNLGIEKATGEWITFVDADDWIAPNMYGRMISAGTDSDIVCCSVTNVYQDKKKIECPAFENEEVVAGGEIRDRIICPLLTPGDMRARLLQSPCNKIYRSSVMTYAQIRFDTKLRYAEDWMLNINYFCYAKSVVFLHDTLYFYDRTTAGSLSKKWRPDCFDSEVYIAHKLRSCVSWFYKNKDINSDILWSQYSCLRNYVYFNGLYGFQNYAKSLFMNSDLKYAYINTPPRKEISSSKREHAIQ